MVSEVGHWPDSGGSAFALEPVVGLMYIAAHMLDTGEKESEDGRRFPTGLAKSGAIKKTAQYAWKHQLGCGRSRSQEKATPVGAVVAPR
jgi:hypothetical protein